MKYFDSHCHLDMEPLVGEQSAVIERAAKANVGAMINVGASLRGSRRSVDLANSYPNIWAAIGLHPHEAGTLLDLDSNIDELRMLAEKDKVVAVGEIGLDYFDPESGKEVTGEVKLSQKDLFERQLDLSLEQGLPVVLHIRDAWEDALAIVKKKNIGIGVVHCFTGTPEVASRFLELGFYIGFTGFVTFEQPKFDHIREAAAATPLEKILIETDAPFLSPEPYRGKTNEPAYVVDVAKKIAEIKGVSVSEVAVASVKNVEKVFNIVS